MSETITLFIPKADEWINSNDRHHWSTRSRRTRHWRDAARFMARHHKIPALGLPVAIDAYIVKARAGRYDPNNLSPTTKACIDGLVDAGVLPDDSWRELIGPDHRHGGKGTPGIRLEIRQVNSTA